MTIQRRYHDDHDVCERAPRRAGDGGLGEGARLRFAENPAADEQHDHSAGHEIERRLEEAIPSGFDPEPYLERMEAPGLWVYGDQDTSVPVARSVANLQRIAEELNKDFTVVVLPNVNHEWIVGGAMCQSTGPTIDPDILFDWLIPLLH